jgi:hypothetical protein
VTLGTPHQGTQLARTSATAAAGPSAHSRLAVDSGAGRASPGLPCPLCCVLQ